MPIAAINFLTGRPLRSFSSSQSRIAPLEAGHGRGSSSYGRQFQVPA
jgi:hypothetical protein